MSKQSYNLDYDQTKASDGSKWPRTVAIFVVIALVTAGIIYLVVPKSEKTTAATQNGSETVGVTPTPETIVPATETATVKPANPTAKSGNDTVIGDTEKVDTPKTDVEVTSPVTTDPVKGKPHPSDPPRDEPVIAPDGIEPGFVKTETAKVEALLKAGQYAQARDAAKTLLKQLTNDSRQYRDVAKLLTLANVKLYFSSGTGGSDEFYKVQTGDTLFKIARKHNTTVDALLKLNNLKSADLIKVNQKIRIGNPNWQLEINKESRLLKVYAAQELFAVYDIGIGRLGRTPAGKFNIGEKIENPDYRAPENKMIRAGEPGNELGSRWMRLVAAPGSTAAPEGYGIHGTPHEDSVTRSLSNGCIRMRNREVEELFLIVPAGTPVEIN